MGFFDLFRRKRPAATATVGGYVQEREKNSDLTGTRRYTTFASLVSNTSIIAAAVRTYLNYAGSVGWRLDPADEDSAEAERIAELADEILHDMRRPWHRVVRRAATQPLYGFDIQERTLKRRPDGAIGYLSIYPRPQHTIDRWHVDEVTGELLGVIQVHPATGKEIYLPRWKIVYVGDDSLTDDPRGLALLRQVTPAAKRLMRYEQIEGIGFDTDLRGIPVGYAPFAEIKQQQDQSLKTKADASAEPNALETFIQRHIKHPELGIVLDSMVYSSRDEAQTPSGQRMWGLELLKGNGAGLAEMGVAIERLNHEIARALGVEFLLLGQTKGTQALSDSKIEGFKLQVETILDELAWTFQQDVIKPLALANGWPEDLVPSIEHDPVRQGDIESIARSLADMARAGATIERDDPVIDAWRDLARLPRQPEVDLEAESMLRREPQNPDEPPDEEDDGAVDIEMDDEE